MPPPCLHMSWAASDFVFDTVVSRFQLVGDFNKKFAVSLNNLYLFLASIQIRHFLFPSWPLLIGSQNYGEPRKTLQDVKYYLLGKMHYY